jgi:hypothetical protein
MRITKMRFSVLDKRDCEPGNTEGSSNLFSAPLAQHKGCKGSFADTARQNKQESNLSMMMRLAVSAFGWQGRKKDDDSRLNLYENGRYWYVTSQVSGCGLRACTRSRGS